MAAVAGLVLRRRAGWRLTRYGLELFDHDGCTYAAPLAGIRYVSFDASDGSVTVTPKQGSAHTLALPAKQVRGLIGALESRGVSTRAQISGI